MRSNIHSARHQLCDTCRACILLAGGCTTPSPALSHAHELLSCSTPSSGSRGWSPSRVRNAGGRKRMRQLTSFSLRSRRAAASENDHQRTLQKRHGPCWGSQRIRLRVSVARKPLQMRASIYSPAFALLLGAPAQIAAASCVRHDSAELTTCLFVFGLHKRICPSLDCHVKLTS